MVGVEQLLKFGIQNGLNVARAGYSEDQILTACMLADRTGYDSIFYMDHTNVPQWKNAIVLDPWVMLSSIAAVTNHVELGTCVTDAIRRHPSNIALAAITLDRVSKGRAILGIGAGEAQNLKEFCIPFEKPVSRDLKISTDKLTVNQALDQLICYLKEKKGIEL